MRESIVNVAPLLVGRTLKFSHTNLIVYEQGEKTLVGVPCNVKFTIVEHLKSSNTFILSGNGHGVHKTVKHFGKGPLRVSEYDLMIVIVDRALRKPYSPRVRHRVNGGVAKPLRKMKRRNDG